jgi:hypothetical protein
LVAMRAVISFAQRCRQDMLAVADVLGIAGLG